MSTLASQNGFDLVVSGIVGCHLKKRAGSDWFRDKEPVDPDVIYTALVTTMMTGGIAWGEDRKVESISAVDVATAGILKKPPESYKNYYSSMMLLDPEGLVCTFTSSSWGGKGAFQSLLVQYKMRGQTSSRWLSCHRGQEAISTAPSTLSFRLSDGSRPESSWRSPALAAPNPGPEKSDTAKTKKATAEIVNDEIPF